MHTIGIVAGSFDPITKGHEWLIQEAARLVDELHVVIGVNHTKQYMFDDATRRALVESSVKNMRLVGIPIRVHFLSNELLIQFAVKNNATHLIRGIRDTNDFNYETQMASVNRKIAPEVKTVYMVPPPQLSEVSSSTVKSLLGVQGWQDIVKGYVSPAVLKAFEKKLSSFESDNDKKQN